MRKLNVLICSVFAVSAFASLFSMEPEKAKKKLSKKERLRRIMAEIEKSQKEFFLERPEEEMKRQYEKEVELLEKRKREEHEEGKFLVTESWRREFNNAKRYLKGVKEYADRVKRLSALVKSQREKGVESIDIAINLETLENAKRMLKMHEDDLLKVKGGCPFTLMPREIVSVARTGAFGPVLVAKDCKRMKRRKGFVDPQSCKFEELTRSDKLKKGDYVYVRLFAFYEGDLEMPKDIKIRYKKLFGGKLPPCKDAKLYRKDRDTKKLQHFANTLQFMLKCEVTKAGKADISPEVECEYQRGKDKIFARFKLVFIEEEGKYFLLSE